MENIRDSIISGILFGVCYFSINLLFGNNIGWFWAILYSLIMGVSTYYFATSKRIDKQTKILFNENELIYSDRASRFLNFEAVGGKLYLTKNHMIFKSHNWNWQNHELKIDVKNISLINIKKTLGINPNRLEVILNNEDKVTFIISNSKIWEKKVQNIKK